MIEEYYFGIERSTRIIDYQLKGCMECQKLEMKTSRSYHRG